MKIGDPLDRSTDHGPQNHRAHLESLLDYCKTGAKEGATLVYGGKQCDRPGNNITIIFVLRALHSFAARRGDRKPDKSQANDSWRASYHQEGMQWSATPERTNIVNQC